ncbi:MAG TPA: GNAT family N-acetyltransferase [Mycobacteriales bacterium]|nr:GNAT family N-acetyltransferase [Mycobacteriales bacterium]
MWDELIGRRVVVRRRITPPADPKHDTGAKYSDVLGTLIRADAALHIERSNGEVVTVPGSEVHRVKAIPPARVRVLPSPIAPLALEEITALGWPAPATARLGRWLLRAADGYTRRANSVLPLGPAGLPVEAAIDRAREWYAERRLPLRFQLPTPGTEALDEILEKQHFLRENLTFVHVAPVGAIMATAPAREDLPPVRLQNYPGAAWQQMQEPITPIAQAVLTGARLPVFATVADGETTIATARAVVDFDWLGITALQVAPEYRRRGIAMHVMRALGAWGRSNGARNSYLQVEEANHGAIDLYERLGYVMHHEYHYRLGLP